MILPHSNLFYCPKTCIESNGRRLVDHDALPRPQALVLSGIYISRPVQTAALQSAGLLPQTGSTERPCITIHA